MRGALDGCGGIVTQRSMSASANAPAALPDRATLIRVMSARRPIPVRTAAAILHRTPLSVRRAARDADALLPGDTVAWAEVARWLLERWPLAILVSVLGSAVHLLPQGLHPLPLITQQPAYIVHALRAQWRFGALPHRFAPAATFDDYLSDLFHRAIEPETIAALRHDPEFVRAYTLIEGGAE